MFALMLKFYVIYFLLLHYKYFMFPAMEVTFNFANNVRLLMKNISPDLVTVLKLLYE